MDNAQIESIIRTIAIASVAIYFAVYLIAFVVDWRGRRRWRRRDRFRRTLQIARAAHARGIERGRFQEQVRLAKRASIVARIIDRRTNEMEAARVPSVN